MKEITVTELKQMKDNNNEDFQLIDVREPDEAEICTIGGELIPMGELMAHLDKISKAKKVIFHCKSGSRSGAVVHALTLNGFDNIYNLKGGILAYADQIDPTLTKY